MIARVFILFLFIYGCTGKSEKNNFDLKNNLIESKTISIPVGKSVYYKSNYTYVSYDGDSTYILRRNAMTNSLISYNLDRKRKKRVKEYIFKTEGPSKIIKFDRAGIYQLKDSMFILADAYSNIYITKKDSVIYRKYFDDTGIGNGNIMNGINSFLPIKAGSNIYFNRRPSLVVGHKSYYLESLLVSFDIQKKKLTERNLRYPKSYKQDVCWSFHQLYPSFTKSSSNEIIYSFPIDPNIYVYNIDKDSVVRKINATSNFAKKYKPIPLPSHDSREISNEEYYGIIGRSSIYYAIKYDKYKDIYYRIILLPSDNPNDKLKNIDDIEIFMQISIMVLNNKFEVLAEKKLPNKTYIYEDFFVTKEGLWLSKNNPENPNFDEDVLVFEVFNFKKSI